jgi:hypothetical protein
MTQKTNNDVTLECGGSTLTLDAAGGLTFSPDRRTRWHTDSLCLLHYYDRQHPRAQQVRVPWDDTRAFGTMGTLSLSARSTLAIRQLDERKAEVDVVCDTIHLRMTLRIEMDPAGEGFDVSIAPDGVREEHPRLYRLLGVEFLPEFGAARTSEPGYLTLPNWFGCQTFFDKAYPREVWQTIYSSNDQWENNCNAPVFGITRAQGTLCGLVAAGDEDAQLVCRRHWEEAQANSVHPYLVWRWAQEDDAIAGPRRVQEDDAIAGPRRVQEDDAIAGPRRVQYRVAPASGPHGEGYAFVGVQYRTFLRAKRGVLPWAEKGEQRPEALDYTGRFFLKLFMAYKDPRPDGKGEYHCVCTCDEAREILAQCLARGMKKLTVVLTGWGQDGHDGKCPTYLPVDERVGGDAKMRELIAWAKAQDILLCVHTSHYAAYECSDEFTVNDLIRHRSGETWKSIVWSGGHEHRLCPQVALNKYVKRDLPKLAALGFHGHHHFDCVGKLDIAGRWEPAPGVSRTRYRDGTEVWVNRGEREFDGLAVGTFRIAAPS